MADIYFNLTSGTLTADPGAAGVTLDSAAFVNLPTVASPDTMRLVLDPDGALGLPEIVLVTTHTAAATSCTVTRGQETGFGGNAGLAHAIGTVWRASVTRAAFEELPYRKVTTKGDLLVASAGKTISRVAVGANTTVLVADSSQANGVRWAPETELNLVDAKGDIVAGSADNTIAKLTVGANDTRLVADSTQATGLRYAPDTELKLVAAKGDLLVGTANDTLSVKSVGTDGTFLMADTASAGGVKWNAGALAAWTPVVVQGATPTLTVQSSMVQRIGRLVYFDAVVTITSAGTGNTVITMSLPIASKTYDAHSSLGEGHITITAAVKRHPAELIWNSTTTMKFHIRDGAGTGTTEGVYMGTTASNVANAGLANGDIISVHGNYEAGAD